MNEYIFNFEICRAKFRTKITASSEFEARKKLLEYIKGSLVVGEVEKKEKKDYGFDTINDIFNSFK